MILINEQGYFSGHQWQLVCLSVLPSLFHTWYLYSASKNIDLLRFSDLVCTVESIVSTSLCIAVLKA